MWVFFSLVSNGVILCLKKKKIDSDISFDQKKKKDFYSLKKPKGNLKNTLKTDFHFAI